MSIVEKAISRFKAMEQEKAQLAAIGAPPASDAAVAVIVSGGTPPPGESGRDGKFIMVDRNRMQEEGFLVPENCQRQMADEYRRIKRPLVANAFGMGVPSIPDGNLILVSSAVSGEGKTHTCFNLALSLAVERDRTVLLVDGDVAKPHISRLFGLADQPGLLDALSDDLLEAEQLLFRTDIPRLSVLPAGRWRDYATELLASGRMRLLCQALGRLYPDRIILFDSPPLLASTEGQAIGAAVGQVVLVIAENKTARDDVRSALGLLDEQKPINAILNMSRRPLFGGYHYGGYGYGAHSQAELQASDAGRG